MSFPLSSLFSFRPKPSAGAHAELTVGRRYSAGSGSGHSTSRLCGSGELAALRSGAGDGLAHVGPSSSSQTGSNDVRPVWGPVPFVDHVFRGGLRLGSPSGVPSLGDPIGVWCISISI